VKDHELTLTNLPAEGAVYYRIQNIDRAGNSIRGPERSFSTETTDGNTILLPVILDR